MCLSNVINEEKSPPDEKLSDGKIGRNLDFGFHITNYLDLGFRIYLYKRQIRDPKSQIPNRIKDGSG